MAKTDKTVEALGKLEKGLIQLGCSVVIFLFGLFLMWFAWMIW